MSKKAQLTFTKLANDANTALAGATSGGLVGATIGYHRDSRRITPGHWKEIDVQNTVSKGKRTYKKPKNMKHLFRQLGRRYPHVLGYGAVGALTGASFASIYGQPKNKKDKTMRKKAEHVFEKIAKDTFQVLQKGEDKRVQFNPALNYSKADKGEYKEQKLKQINETHQPKRREKLTSNEKTTGTALTSLGTMAGVAAGQSVKQMASRGAIGAAIVGGSYLASKEIPRYFKRKSENKKINQQKEQRTQQVKKVVNDENTQVYKTERKPESGKYRGKKFVDNKTGLTLDKYQTAYSSDYSPMYGTRKSLIPPNREDFETLGGAGDGHQYYVRNKKTNKIYSWANDGTVGSDKTHGLRLIDKKYVKDNKKWQKRLGSRNNNNEK